MFLNKKDKDERVAEFLKTITTQLSNKNLQLRQNMSELNTYFNSVPILYIVTDYNLNIQNANQTAKEIFLKDKPLNTMNISDLIHPNHKEIFIKKFKQLNQPDDYLLKMIKGKYEVIHIKWGFKKISNQQIMWFGQNVTEQVENAHKLEKYVSFKKAILKCYPGAIVATDLSGQIKEFNKSAQLLSGYDEETAMKMHIFDIIPKKEIFLGDDIDKIRKAKLIRKSKDKIDIVAMLTPLKDDYDNVMGYLIVMHDTEILSNMLKFI